MTLTYPGSIPPLVITAMKFTGTAASGNYVAYVFSPKDYQTGCGNGSIRDPELFHPDVTGYQVFAGDGALNTPVSTTSYSNCCWATVCCHPLLRSYGADGYNAVVGRLGFLISGAMNRGVATTPCTIDQLNWQCWQDETYWYPTTVSSTFPDITQNLFSLWMHTATIGGTPMFKRPPGAVKSAGSIPGTGRTMGMAYGFAVDENPTPTATTPTQPEVPSKLDQTVIYDGPASSYTITFGPWVAASSTPTLSVINPGGGHRHQFASRDQLRFDLQPVLLRRGPRSS